MYYASIDRLLIKRSISMDIYDQVLKSSLIKQMLQSSYLLYTYVRVYVRTYVPVRKLLEQLPKQGDVRNS
jgi:hypothetical protein